MKTIIFSLLILSASLVKGQTIFYKNGIQFVSDSTRPDYILLDSVKTTIYDHYPPDTLYMHFSAWIPNYTFHLEDNVNNGSMQSYFTVTSHQLDSSGGLVKVPLSYFPNLTPAETLQVSIGLAPVFVTVNLIGDNNFYTTSLTSAIQQSKTGTVTVYDIQGRLIKQSPVAEYTQGLAPGTLYIYNALYTDGTADRGKFLIE